MTTRLSKLFAGALVVSGITLCGMAVTKADEFVELSVTQLDKITAGDLWGYSAVASGPASVSLIVSVTEGKRKGIQDEVKMLREDGYTVKTFKVKAN